MVKGKCSGCGTPLEIAVAGPFAGAELISALCPACTERSFREQGGGIFIFERDPPGARFRLGKITITGGAVKALEQGAQHAAEFLVRHVQGDWGSIGHCDQVQLTTDELQKGWEATEDSGKINKSNLLNQRGEIMSEYLTAAGQRLWIITALGLAPATTMLLPEEY